MFIPSDLKSGKSLRCRWCADHQYSPGESTLNRIYYDYRVKGQERGLSWNLSKESFAELISKNCFYCNEPPRRVVMKRYYGEMVCNGLDRKNNQLGYEPENVVPCCITCNRAKNAMNQETFLAWIRKVYNYYGITSRFQSSSK